MGPKGPDGAMSRFTALFEALVIDWLKEASITAVACQLRMGWDQVDGVMQRAVTRGLARRARKPAAPRRRGRDLLRASRGGTST